MDLAGSLAPYVLTEPPTGRDLVVAVRALLSLFSKTGPLAPDRRRSLPANWASTVNVLEHMAFTAKDAPLMTDDFNPTGAADPAKLRANADRLFQAAG
ncbi:unnamed protein product [Gemmataceae bacterium]|nr:unnamed protein product [Gemmataceae bacterium]VTU00816.1 unnamed protein product [Gemmataceae bacterium]